MKLIDNKITEVLSGKYDYYKITIIFLSIVTAFRVMINLLGLVELSGDEAQYWDWARHLDWCYYSKPPGVAFLIHIGTSVFGTNELGVRIGATVCSFIASLAMFFLAREMYTPKAGVIAAILLTIIPGATFYGIGLTPDSPLIMFWVLSLLFFYLAVEKKQPKYWFALTCSIGLALLCKYAIIFFFVPAIIYLIFSSQGRKSLKTIWPYLSFPASLLFFLPVIYWNSHNNWVTFRHDLGHTHVAEGFIFKPLSLLEFVGGQLLIITPVTAVLILVLLFKYRKKYFFSFCFVVPILAAFLIKSCQGKIQPNWVVTAWLAGLLPLADYFSYKYWQLSDKVKGISRAAISIPAAIAIAVHIPFLIFLIPWPAEKSPVSKISGWKQLAKNVSLSHEQLPEAFIFSDYYMITAELAFYCDDNPTVYCANFGNRMNQYDMWPGFEGKVGQDAIYVPRGRVNEKVYDAFDSVELSVCEIKDLYGKTVKSFNVCKCYNFKGMDLAAPDKF